MNLLIQNCAKITIASKTVGTALHTAAKFGELEVSYGNEENEENLQREF